MTRTFRVRSMARLLWPVALICVVTLGVVFVAMDADARPLILLAGVLALALALGVWMMTRVRLEITPERITYHAIGYRVSGAWTDVTGYAKRPMGIRDIESLILRRPGLEMSGWLSAGTALSSVLSVFGDQVPRSMDTERGDAIPVGMFDPDWRSGEIGALVRRYAPAAIDTPANARSVT